MALWGSSRTRISGPVTGSFILPGPTPYPPLPQFDPRRFESNGLIDIPAGNPQTGMAQDAANAPIGPFVVTLSPLTLQNGRPMAQATGDQAVIFDYAALVKWGRGGAQHTALVDWPVNGGTFVVSGDSLYVSMWAILSNLTALTTSAFGLGYELVYGAHATPIKSSAAGSFLAPRRTMPSPTQPLPIGGTTGEMFVPPFSRRWSWQYSNVTGFGTNIANVLYRRFGVTFAQDQFVMQSNQAGSARDCPLPPSTQTVVVNNVSSAGTPDWQQVALVFTLDLGGG